MTGSNTASRRLLLQAMAGAGLASLAGGSAWAAASRGRAQVLMLSDLHSAYGRLAPLLETMRRVVRRDRAPSLILLDGDLFEHGNVVAQRTGGALDWAFIEALTRLAPVVINLGNHDADLVDDQQKTIDRARALGITVLSNIVDARTGRPAATSRATLDLGFPVHLIGIATNSLDTYPKDIRPTLSVPVPAAWAAANLPKAAPDDGLLIVMSHAGLPADKLILPSVPDGTLYLGGHDHLTFDHAQGRTRYVHTGAWGEPLSVATIDLTDKVAPIRITRIHVDPAGPADPALAALVASTLKAQLTPAETAVVARIPKALSLGDTGRAVAAIMARAAGADVGFMGHTTLGTGLPAGDLTQYAYDAVVRFDGTIMRAEVSAQVLADILSRANQDGDLPLDRRTGDFVYGAPTRPPAKDRYVIVTTDWCAKRQKGYFGREDLVFTEVPGLKVKQAIKDGLKG
jgi:2',3'-cyclic-nucleotide 2'-phosphodiesterase (5'-nucleotidase family)